MKKLLYPFSLILIFAALTAAVIPDGSVFGSNTDWLSQHVTLAETIRSACLEQGTLLPSWIDLGGGSNGYQFSYYGFLRPDILLGCLLPEISMLNIVIAYMMFLCLASVLLCYTWLKSEGMKDSAAWTGSILFMTAGCMFHMHRQIMFVNYLPFLLAALLCVRKKRRKLLPLFLFLICIHSFYFAIAAFAAIGWYWYRTEEREGIAFFRISFLRSYVPAAVLGAGMAAALLLPTGLVLLEHRRSGEGISLLSVLSLFAPNPAMNNLLFNEYGMGLTFICFYVILTCIRQKDYRKDSILFLLFGLFGIFSWVLNGTLYARPKILIPFMPLVVLHCVRFLQNEKQHPLWPFAVIFPLGLLWFSQPQFGWILAEAGILFALCGARRLRYRHLWKRLPGSSVFLSAARALAVCLALISPVGMFLVTAESEDWVKRSEIQAGFQPEELAGIKMDPLYHFDSMDSPLISGNETPKTGMPRSTMYSSVTNQAYSDLYYDTLMTPIRINNRVALLTSANPFMLNLLGVRYLETTADAVPEGWNTVLESSEHVIAENENVLPSAYFTDDVVPQQYWDTLEPLQKLDLITRKTVVEGTAGNADSQSSDSANMRAFEPEFSSTDIPDGLKITPTQNGFEIAAEENCTFTVDLENPSPGDIVLLQFQVENKTTQPVVIDINNIRNKLSGFFAPYPNGNDCFHYQLSGDSETGVNRIEITFSKGHYVLNEIEWHLYDRELFAEKQYTPLIPNDAPASAASETAASGNTSVLSGSLTAESDGYIATTIPMQNGLQILVDGERVPLVTVNEAFAGAYVAEGSHQIEITFSPPGKTAGCAVSLLSSAVYVIWLLSAALQRRKQEIEKAGDRKSKGQE